MPTFKKVGIVSGLASGLVAIGAAVAVAATSGSVDLSTTGVHFTGSYVFYAQGTNQGGFGYPGKVCDTASDGNSVFVQAQTEGYGYGGRVYDSSGNGTCVSENNYVYDPSALYVNSGRIQTCQDRGTLFSDLCKASPIYYR